MKITNINNSAIKKNKKYKMLISAYILSGILTLTGCTLNNKEITEPSNISQTENQKTYSSKLVFNNLEYLNGRDVIAIYDNDGNIYSGYYIYPNEDTHEIRVPVQDFIVSSELLGEVDVHIEENEDAYINIDYLNKTINVEKQIELDEKIK